MAELIPDLTVAAGWLPQAFMIIMDLAMLALVILDGFDLGVGLFMRAFQGLAYSLFSWILIDRLTIWDAAAAPESLTVSFIGAGVVLPVVVAYSVFVYCVFGGKMTPHEYY